MNCKRRILAAVFPVLLLVVVIAGCGEASNLVSAGGTVTLNGEPLANANVNLLYDDGQVSVGSTDAQGKFTLTTGGRPGAPVGMAKVSITKMTQTTPGGMPENPTPEDMMKMYEGMGGKAEMQKLSEAESEIPESYADAAKSGLTADVQASGDNQFVFDLKE